jgi:AAA domain
MSNTGSFSSAFRNIREKRSDNVEDSSRALKRFKPNALLGFQDINAQSERLRMEEEELGETKSIPARDYEARIARFPDYLSRLALSTGTDVTLLRSPYWTQPQTKPSDVPKFCEPQQGGHRVQTWNLGSWQPTMFMPILPLYPTGESAVTFSRTVAEEEVQVTLRPSDITLGTFEADRPIAIRWILQTQEPWLELRLQIPEFQADGIHVRPLVQIHLENLQVVETETGLHTTLSFEAGACLSDLASSKNAIRGVIKDEKTNTAIVNKSALEATIKVRDTSLIRRLNLPPGGEELLDAAVRLICDKAGLYESRGYLDESGACGLAEVVDFMESDARPKQIFSRELLFLAALTYVKGWLIYMPYPRWLDNKFDVGSKAFSFIEDLVRVTNLYGNMWFYKLQLSYKGYDLNTTNMKMSVFRDLRKPWWMEKKWVFNNRSEYRPVEWVTSEFLPNTGTESATWLARLALARDTISTSDYIRQLAEKYAEDITVQFIKNPNPNQPVICGISLGIGADGELRQLDPSGQILRPIQNTKFRITLTALANNDGEIVDNSPEAGDGMEVDEIQIPKDRIDASALEHIEELDNAVADISFFGLLQRKLPSGVPFNKTFSAYVEWIDDPTSNMRQIAAIEVLGIVQHHAGRMFNSRMLIFGHPPTSKDISDWTRTCSPEAFQKVREALQSDLQDEALDAALAMVSPILPTGVVLVQGPPGCGKSYLAQKVFSQVAMSLKKTVLVTAEKRAAIRVLVDRFAQDDSSLEINWVVFDTAKPNIALMTWDDIGISYNVNEEAVSAYDASNFFIRLDEWRQRLRLHFTHAHHNIVKKVDELESRQKELKELDRKLTPDEQQVRYDLAKGRDNMYRAFGKSIDLIFCTNNSAGHHILRTAFEAQVIFMDEAGLSNRGQCAIPIAANYDSLERVFQFGDHQQLKPFIMDNGKNEAIGWLKNSIFELAIHYVKHKFFQLLGSRRMCPELFDFVSKVLYPGSKLRCIRPNVDTERMSLIRDFLKDRLGNILGANPSVRAAFDVSGPRHYSQRVRCSYKNTSEANWIVLFLCSLWNYAIETGRPIPIEEIKIIALYKAQVSTIQSLLRQAAKGRPQLEPLANVLVSTIPFIQGNEADIILLSLVSNRPQQPTKFGFITQPENISVYCSRAKDAFFLFGAFKNFAEAFYERRLTAHGGFQSRELFGKFVEDFLRKDQIVGMEAFEQGFGQGVKPQENDFKDSLSVSAQSESKQHKVQKCRHTSNRHTQGASARGRGGKGGKGKGGRGG